eukprot:m.26187 g.26187  ORF g.26187 m.26187 type:complete len:74 (-) comp9993_c0_seq1:1416-1637(-)
MCACTSNCPTQTMLLYVGMEELCGSFTTSISRLRQAGLSSFLSPSPLHAIAPSPFLLSLSRKLVALTSLSASV